MNDGNVRYYLEQEMAKLENKIKGLNNSIDSVLRNINDWEKEKSNLQIHYTSLLNTAIAYGYEVEEDE